VTAECIHGLGPVAACTICNGKDRAARNQPQWRYFPARYAGQCGACDLPITIGQVIAWCEDNPVIHEGCV